MAKFESYPSFPQILSRLMADRGLKERDVVKATGLPQTTISNILRGKSRNPRPLTLKLLGELFGLTIEQLVGYEALETALPAGSNKITDEVKLKRPSLAPLNIPLIEWHEVESWLSGKRAVKAYTVWLPNNICRSPKAFALQVKDSMHFYFFPPRGIGKMRTVILLVDPDASIEDGCMVLAFLKDSKEPTLRLFALDGSEKWLNPLDTKKSAIALTLEHLIVGPVVELRYRPGS